MIRVPASVIRAAALFTGKAKTLAHVSVRGGERCWDVCATDGASIFRATNGGDLSAVGEMLVDVSRLAKLLRVGDKSVTLEDVGGGFVRADVCDNRRRLRLMGEMLPAEEPSAFPKARELMPSLDETADGSAMVDPKYLARCCKAAEYLKSSDLLLSFATSVSKQGVGRIEAGSAKLIVADLAPRKLEADIRVLVCPRR